MDGMKDKRWTEMFNKCYPAMYKEKEKQTAIRLRGIYKEKEKQTAIKLPLMWE